MLVKYPSERQSYLVDAVSDDCLQKTDKFWKKKNSYFEKKSHLFCEYSFVYSDFPFWEALCLPYFSAARCCLLYYYYYYFLLIIYMFLDEKNRTTTGKHQSRLFMKRMYRCSSYTSLAPPDILIYCFFLLCCTYKLIGTYTFVNRLERNITYLLLWQFFHIAQ